MYGLFWRIFLWFWVAMVVMGGAIAWTTAQIGRERIPLMIERDKAQFAESITRAEDVLRAHGINGLKDWLKDPRHVRGMRVFVLDPGGREMLGNVVPPQLKAIAPMLGMQGIPGEESRAHRGLIVRPVAVPGEGFYYLVVVFRPPHPVWRLFSIPGLLLALAISALVCLGLARYLSAPVRRLRDATQALAAGNLDVRVGAPLGARRDELGGLSRDFDRMAERLQALIESQRRLLRDVSHELRSPLARLQAALGLARQRTAGLATEELDRIERETERLNELIGQVLSLTRLAADTNRALHETVDLATLIGLVAEDAEFEAVQRGCHVLARTSVPATVTGDPELLHSAIENVVRNAVRYTADGTAVEISLGTDAERRHAVITVSDHGPGVGEDVLTEIFEPFFRASEARDRASGGHGLGLAIARRAVELHGGSIAAANAPGGGLIVTIRLPLTDGETARFSGAPER